MITNRVEFRKPPACGKIFGLCTKLVKVGINTYYTITTIYSEKKVPLFCYGYILTHYEHVYILEAIHYIMHWVHTHTQRLCHENIQLSPIIHKRKVQLDFQNTDTFVIIPC